MAYSVFPAPVAATSKIARKVTLTSGTSWTVPAGVTAINVTCVGGGAGGMGGGYSSTGWGQFTPQAVGGQIITSTVNTTPGASISYSIGAGGTGQGLSGSPQPGAGGTTSFTGATSASGGSAHTNRYGTPQTPNNGRAMNGGLSAYSQPGAINELQIGGAGGSGYIDIEYWV